MLKVHTVMTAALAVLPALAATPDSAAPESTPSTPRIAVFAFELDDLSPASALLHASTSSEESLERAARAARDALEKSGRYRVIDAHLEAAPAGGWRGCEGCETAAAVRLGADQSLLGIVRRATQTDYYVLVQIRDARTGRLLDEESANFAGGEEGWASGVRMLMKHQVLVAMAPDAAAAGATTTDSAAAGATTTDSAAAGATTTGSAAAGATRAASAAAGDMTAESAAAGVTTADSAASSTGAAAAPAASTPTCKVAIVNPVSGYAECVEPRGAAVDPPPRPQGPRAHDPDVPAG